MHCRTHSFCSFPPPFFQTPFLHFCSSRADIQHSSNNNITDTLTRFKMFDAAGVVGDDDAHC